MILTFKEPTFAEKPLIDLAVARSDTRVCDQTFGNLFCWQPCYRSAVAVWNESFAARWGGLLALPVGPDRRAMTEALLAAGARKFTCVDAEGAAFLEQAFPGRFRLKEQRNSADYLYPRVVLEELHGKKLAAKRNHIHYFEDTFHWETRVITPALLPELTVFHEKWCESNGCGGASLRAETCAVQRGLRYYEALGFYGLALYAEGALCAFTYGERIGKAGFCVHVEKADTAVRGAYAMINRELVRSLPGDIAWINREDDAGDPGLRQAKLSYQPDPLLLKYDAEVIS